MAIRLEKQLAVFLDNRPGMLARTCQALAHAKVNILALSILDTVDHAIIRMIVDRPKDAERVLTDLRVMLQEVDVICLDVPNAVGALAGIAERLTEAGINIEYAYCTASKNQDFGCIVVKTKDAEQTLEILDEL